MAVVDPNDLARVAVWESPGSGANGVAVDAARVYLVHRNSHSVAVFRRKDGALLGLWPTGILPWGIAVTEDALYVGNYGSGTVTVYDPTTGARLREVPVGPKPALLAALGRAVYVPLVDGELVRLSDQGRVRMLITRVGVGNVGIAVDPARGRVYVGKRDFGTIVVVDDARLAPVAYIAVPARPVGLALSPNGRWLYAVDPFSSTLHVIDLNERRWAAAVPLADQGGEDGGQGILVMGDRLYVSDYGAGTLSVYRLPACALAP